MKRYAPWAIGGALFVLGLALMFLSDNGTLAGKLDESTQQLKKGFPSKKTIELARSEREAVDQQMQERINLAKGLASRLIKDEENYSAAKSEGGANFAAVSWERIKSDLIARVTAFERPRTRWNPVNNLPETPQPGQNAAAAVEGLSTKIINEPKTFADPTSDHRLGRIAASALRDIIDTIGTVAQSRRPDIIEFNNVDFALFASVPAIYGSDDPFVRRTITVRLFVSAEVADDVVAAFALASIYEGDGVPLRYVQHSIGTSEVPAHTDLLYSFDQLRNELRDLNLTNDADALPKTPEEYDEWKKNKWPMVRDRLFAKKPDLRRTLPVVLELRLEVIEAKADSPVWAAVAATTPG